jgi:4-aminobutyrate aminotransferase/(S)-3-amino-2-methylpropionate transaminase
VPWSRQSSSIPLRVTLAKAVAAYAHQRGVITLTCGTWGDIIRFLPPLSITDELLNEGLDIVAAGLEAVR